MEKRWGVGEVGRDRQKDRSGVLPISPPASPDFPDILLGHLHMDDDGVDLILDQFPHAPHTQFQQAVFLLGGQNYILLPARRH